MLAACMRGEVLDFSLEKERADLPLLWRNTETAFPTVTLGVGSCNAVVSAALSEREAVAGSNSDYSHRRPSWVAAFACLATDTRHHNLTLLDQKKERKDESSPLKCPTIATQNAFEIWLYHHQSLCHCCIGLTFHAC